MWILFMVPCPTPDRQTAEDLYRKRVEGITPEMRDSARQLGCRFHRAWTLACWETREGASAFFERWEIEDEPGEVALRLEGDVGLVPEP